MNQWPNANHNHDWSAASAPPKIEVRENQHVFRNGWHVGDLVPTDSFNQDIFEGVQDTLEDHFKNQDNRGIPPGAAPHRPSTVPDTPDDSFVNLCPSPLPDDQDLWPQDDNLTAKEFSCDINIPNSVERRLERYGYLNRLLSHKLDLTKGV